MPIRLRHNDQLEISRVDYHGLLRGKELHDHAAFNAQNPAWLGFDCINVVDPRIDLSAISPADLEEVFDAHRELFEPLQLLFMRRSAWVCSDPAAQRLLSYWISKRTGQRNQWADVRQFPSFEAAGEWLLVSADALAALESGQGFKEIARFEAPPAPAR